LTAQRSTPQAVIASALGDAVAFAGSTAMLAGKAVWLK
jgi:hypothetical protein